jgi:hypothetical protein
MSKRRPSEQRLDWRTHALATRQKQHARTAALEQQVADLTHQFASAQARASLIPSPAAAGLTTTFGVRLDTLLAICAVHSS